jgi:uncharacterized phage infection (PIP) family protein YhgE
LVGFMAVDDININVNVTGAEKVKVLSNAMRELNASMLGTGQSIKDIDPWGRALSTALGRTEKGMNDHAKSVSQLITNQRSLGKEMSDTSKQITQYTSGLLSNTKGAKENAAGLKVYNENLKGIKARALKEDIAGVALEMRRLGKDAQFTGRAGPECGHLARPA